MLSQAIMGSLKVDKRNDKVGSDQNAIQVITTLKMCKTNSLSKATKFTSYVFWLKQTMRPEYIVNPISIAISFEK